MEYRTLDVTFVSAEDLKKVTLFSKMQPYAVAWVDPYNRHSTHVDKLGGVNPSWNERLSFPVPEHFFQQTSSHLHVEIYSKSSVFGNKFVGAAAIPLSEFSQESTRKEVVMYQLRRRSGKVKGAVKLLVRLGEKTAMSEQAAYRGAAATSLTDPVTAYPYSNQKPQQPNYYPQATYGGYQPAYPPQQQYQPYPPQGYYPPQQGYYPQQQYVQPARRPGMMGGMGGMGGMGMGTGLLAGALGGLIVGDMLDNSFDNGGGFDGGGFDGGGFDGGGFDGGF